MTNFVCPAFDTLIVDNVFANLRLALPSVFVAAIGTCRS